MDVFANFLIGLREGLEAALVVGILVAYLVKSGHRDLLPRVWAGVGIAVVVSLAAGAALTYGPRGLSFEAQEAIGGVLSIVAVGFVTWMIFWMARTSRQLKGELEGRMNTAIISGGASLTILATLAVGREGLRLDLGKFFRWTGAFLVVVAAGVLAYGVHDLQEAGILPGLNNLAFDVSDTIPPSSWYGTLLKGTFNFSPSTTWLELIVWVAYLVPVLTLFILSVRRPYPVASTPPSMPAHAAR